MSKKRSKRKSCSRCGNKLVYNKVVKSKKYVSEHYVCNSCGIIGAFLTIIKNQKK